jgi:hypothetical protein
MMSPDGTLVAYMDLEPPTFSVQLIDLASGSERTFGDALPPPAANPGLGVISAGFPVFSPDGSLIAFGRYWDEHDGTVNHRVWIASTLGDGADAIPVGPVHRSRSGHNPFGYTFSPDGKQLIIQMNEVAETWIADPADGTSEQLPWGRMMADPPDWQRLSP